MNKDILRMAAMLHDAGKVAISDAILKKPAKLTDEEYNIMKTHNPYLTMCILTTSKNNLPKKKLQRFKLKTQQQLLFMK